MTKISVAILWLLVLCHAGCAPPPPSQGGFNSDDTASKLYAVIQAGRTKDQSAIKPLIEQLNHDDPVVRMMAINALHRITGTRLGYNPYATTSDRRAAITAWTDAARNGKWDP